MAPELARWSGYQITSHSGTFLYAGTKADAIVFDAEPQFSFDSFKGSTDSARTDALWATDSRVRYLLSEHTCL